MLHVVLYLIDAALSSMLMMAFRRFALPMAKALLFFVSLALILTALAQPAFGSADHYAQNSYYWVDRVQGSPRVSTCEPGATRMTEGFALSLGDPTQKFIPMLYNTQYEFPEMTLVQMEVGAMIERDLPVRVRVLSMPEEQASGGSQSSFANVEPDMVGSVSPRSLQRWLFDFARIRFQGPQRVPLDWKDQSGVYIRPVLYRDDGGQLKPLVVPEGPDDLDSLHDEDTELYTLASKCEGQAFQLFEVLKLVESAGSASPSAASTNKIKLKSLNQYLGLNRNNLQPLLGSQMLRFHEAEVVVPESAAATAADTNSMQEINQQATAQPAAASADKMAAQSGAGTAASPSQPLVRMASFWQRGQVRPESTPLFMSQLLKTSKPLTKGTPLSRVAESISGESGTEINGKHYTYVIIDDGPWVNSRGYVLTEDIEIQLNSPLPSERPPQRPEPAPVVASSQSPQMQPASASAAQQAPATVGPRPSPQASAAQAGGPSVQASSARPQSTPAIAASTPAPELAAATPAAQQPRPQAMAAPLPTSVTVGQTVFDGLYPLRTQTLVPYTGSRRHFRAPRSTRNGRPRLHAGIDLIAEDTADARCAVAAFDGELMYKPYLFVRPDWWALWVRFDGLDRPIEAQYAEVQQIPSQFSKKGDRFQRGECLGQPIRTNNGFRMLHFEMYWGEVDSHPNPSNPPPGVMCPANDQGAMFFRKADIMEPTSVLHRWESNSFRNHKFPVDGYPPLEVPECRFEP